MSENNIQPAPTWVRIAATVIRHLPAGRYRVMNNICRRPPSAFSMRTPEELGGFTFKCDLRDTISREVCFTGRYEPQETALVKAILRLGMSFVDVGANWGYFTLLAAHLVGKGGRVLSLEPDPRLFPILQNNVARNCLSQATALQIAAANKAGVLKLAGYDEIGGNFGISRVVSNGAELSTFDVAAKPLDELFEEIGLDVVDLLKMDIEGFEGFALMGLAKSLSSQRIKRLLLELHPGQLAEHGQSALDIIQMLRHQGYCPWRIDHSYAMRHRIAYSKQIDLKSTLQPLDEQSSLDDWPHLLWTMPDLELLW